MTEDDQRARGGLNYFQPTSNNGQKSQDRRPSENEIINEYSSAESNTFLEHLIQESSTSKLPIVVTDQEKRLWGIILKDRLLSAHTTV